MHTHTHIPSHRHTHTHQLTKVILTPDNVFLCVCVFIYFSIVTFDFLAVFPSSFHVCLFHHFCVLYSLQQEPIVCLSFGLVPLWGGWAQSLWSVCVLMCWPQGATPLFCSNLWWVCSSFHHGSICLPIHAHNKAYVDSECSMHRYKRLCARMWPATSRMLLYVEFSCPDKG